MLFILTLLSFIFEFIIKNPILAISIIFLTIFLISIGIYFFKDRLMSYIPQEYLPESMVQHKPPVHMASNEEESERIAGLDDQLDIIHKEVTLARSISDELKRELELRDVRGVILYGPPGTGKTMLARNLAKMIGCKSTKKIAGVSLFNKYVGESERQLRDAFKHPIGQLHMVIIDEIDSICNKRSEDMSMTKVYSTMTNQMLSLMDGLDSDPEVIVVGTTNRLSAIDDALLRPGRFDLQIEVKIPNRENRKKIIDVYSHKLVSRGYIENFDIEDILDKTDGYSGAQIENVFRKAKLLALNRHARSNDPYKISSEDLQKSIINGVGG